MDWNVYPGSKIAKLNPLLRPFALTLRNVQALKPPPRPHHRLDGITTQHDDSFRRDPTFKRAYDRAVQAGGWDFGIPYRVQQALWCARQALKIEGAFVELGTGRGFVMSAIMEGVAPPRTVHLFDSFLSAAPREGTGEQTGKPNPHYANSIEAVRDNFAEWPNVQLHPGDIGETLCDLGPVAFLHVDLNFAKAEEIGIRHFWPFMPQGAVMLLDDYAHSGFAEIHAAHDRLAEEFGFDILATPTGQGIVIK